MWVTWHIRAIQRIEASQGAFSRHAKTSLPRVERPCKHNTRHRHFPATPLFDQPHSSTATYRLELLDNRWRLMRTVVEESPQYLQSPRVLCGASALTIAAAVVAVLAV